MKILVTHTMIRVTMRRRKGTMIMLWRFVFETLALDTLKLELFRISWLNYSKIIGRPLYMQTRMFAL